MNKERYLYELSKLSNDELLGELLFACSSIIFGESLK